MIDEFKRFSPFTKGLIGFLVVFLSLIFIAVLSSDKNHGMSDHDAFLAYYRQVMAHCKKLDSTYKPFADAMSKQQWMEAAIVAKRIQEPIKQGWIQMDDIAFPTLKNAAAQKDLEMGKESISTCYYHKSKVIEKYIELIKNPNGMMDSGSDIINSGERVQQTMIIAITSLMSAGQKVGVTVDEMKL